MIFALAKRQPSWTQAQLYDAVFALRMLLAAVLGVSCGATGMQGLQTFIAFVAANFIVPSSWFSYQGVDPVAYDDDKQPITMEGFGQAMSLFVLTWVTSFSLTQ